MSKYLWYTKPAGQDWNSALPIGNGRLGAMIFGNINGERIQLNEDSVWGGGTRNRINPDAKKYLPQIRTLLKDEKISEAQDLAVKALSGIPDSMLNYQPLADLWLDFDYSATGACATNNAESLMNTKITSNDEGLPYSNYKRELDLSKAEVKVSFDINGTTFSREHFASFPDKTIAIKLTASQKGSISFSARLSRGNWKAYTSRYFDKIQRMEDEMLIGTGRASGEFGMTYAAGIRCRCLGGKITLIGEMLVVEDADEATLTIAGATTFREADPILFVANTTRAASEKSWSELQSTHRADYCPLFDRVQLQLGNNTSDLPTDQRIAEMLAGGSDLDMQRLFFDYGRYLLLASSRPGSMPANLQGIWCQEMEPAWGSKYTININTEMNYWPAEQCAMSECHDPLFDLLERLLITGRAVAKEMYGCRGFVVHHNTDLVADACPTDRNLSATYWVMGGAWLSLHLWERCLFTGKECDMKRAWPILREASLFFVDFLVENEQGLMVVSPGCSPEHAYRLPNGKAGTFCAGASMDSQIVERLFHATASIAEALKVEPEFAAELNALRDRLPKPTIGKHGQIQEWLEDYEESEPGHRHISQLFALHPGGYIDPLVTPQLAEGAKATLTRRLSHGGGGTGWSRAWIINFYARLLDGKLAQHHLLHLLTSCTLPNLFDNHPPFQIDGNFGACSAIAEMLVQSYRPIKHQKYGQESLATGEHEVHLLPALPPAWAEGNVQGLRVRGGGTVDITWQNGRLTEARLYAPVDSSWQMRYSDKTFNCIIPEGGVYILTTS